MFFVVPKIAEAKCTWNCTKTDLKQANTSMRTVFDGASYSVNVTTYYGNVSAYYQGWYQSNGTFYPIGTGGGTTNNNGGGGGGGGGGCDPNSWGGCSVGCGGGVMYNGCGGSQSCNTQACCDANNWGAGWSACSGTQNTQSRTNACGSVESVDCPRVSGRIYYDPYHVCATDDPSNLGMVT